MSQRLPTEHELEAIDRLLQYLIYEHEELDDFLSSDIQRQARHIYQSVRVVAGWRGITIREEV